MKARFIVLTLLAAPAIALSGTAATSSAKANSAQGSSKIAFVSGNELYVMNADGSGQRILTPGVRRATPAWSPDGRTIAFERPVINVGVEVFVMNDDGSGQRRLTHNEAYDGEPAWSPDGRSIAFRSSRDGKPDVYVMNADGSEQRNLTGDPGNDLRPVWSPDGRKIAFVRKIGFMAPPRVGGPPGFRILYRRYLHVVNADGSGLRRLTPDPVYGDLSPDWSPDGRTIRFGRYLVNADGSGLRRLTRNIPLSGAWSPDGRKIAFRGTFPRGSWGSPSADYDVYVMNADGSGQRRLTRSPAYDGDPVWSPDGRWIAFRSTRDGNAEIYVMNADGSGQRRLTRSPEYERWFAWSPEQTKGAIH